MGEVMAGWLVWLVLGVAGAAAQLNLDCTVPEQARALIDYARLSEIEHVEDIHRDALARTLANCPEGQARLACRAEQQRQADIDWERKVAEIKVRYERMLNEFEEKCRASIAFTNEAASGSTK
jgi:hypothetical protein